MNSNTSLLPLSALAFTPAHTLKKKTIENAKLITHLEGLIRAEKFELGRLLAKQNPPLNTATNSATSVPLPSNNTLQTFSSPAVADPVTVNSSPISDLHSPNYLKHTATPFASPKGIMQSFSSPASSAVPTPASTTESEKCTPPPHQEMAARGSHWSFIEKARFEAAMLKYGPFAWDEIIKAVGSRTEKQVKAYAARYRRRKKLAARMQALPIISYPEVSVHMPLAQDQPTMTPTCYQPERVTSMLPQPTTEATYQDCVRAFGAARPRITPEVPPRVAVETSVPAGDNVTEPSTQAHSECHSSAPASVVAGEPMMDIFTQDLGEIEQGGLAKVETTGLGVEDHSVLEGVEEDGADVAELASQVDLLVDEAIGGSDDILGSGGDKPLVQFNEDPYPQDFINNWFNN